MTSGIHNFFSANVTNPQRNSVADKAVKFGNWTLTPLRYLLKGETVKFFYYDLQNQKQFYDTRSEASFQNRNWLKFAAAIILLIPSVIIGSAFKGAGYLSAVVRQEKTLIDAVKRYRNEPAIRFDNIPKTDPRPKLDRSLARVTGVDSWKKTPTTSKQIEESGNTNLLKALNGHGLNNHTIYMQADQALSNYPHIETIDPRKIVIVNGDFNPSDELTNSLMKLGFLTTDDRRFHVDNLAIDEASNRQLWMNANTLRPAGQVFLVKV